MPRPEITEFAKLLLLEVRDKTIASCDTLLDPGNKNVMARRWQSKTDVPRELAATIIPDCVDETLFHLLHAIDEGLLRLSFVSSDGSVVDLTTGGHSELAGWFMGGGWRAEHSKARFVDDFSDLA